MLIQAKLDSARIPVEVVNAGISGETSSGLVERLDWLLRGNFSMIVIETGANDGLRGIPISALRKNLEAIIQRIRAVNPSAQIVLVQMEALPNLGQRYASEFRAVYPEVARETGVRLTPFLLDGVAGHIELNQADGIHPNSAGERIVADNLWRSLRPALCGDAAVRRCGDEGAMRR